MGYRRKRLNAKLLWPVASGLDVASLIKKMKLEVEEFRIEPLQRLRRKDPKILRQGCGRSIIFKGSNLQRKKIAARS